MELEHRHRFDVTSCDVDAFGQLRVSTLMGFFQEIGRLHSKGIHLSVAELNRQNKTWVLAQMRVRYPLHPPIDTALTITTWPSCRGEWDVVRDFAVTDDAGRTIAEASGTYVIIDLGTRRGTRLGDLIPAAYQLDRQVFADAQRLMPRVAVTGARAQFPVMARDLDVNFHVNNVVYVQWALEAVPTEIWKSHVLVELDVAYRSEIRQGDSVRVAADRVAGEAVEFHHIVEAHSTSAEAARLRTLWVPRPGV